MATVLIAAPEHLPALKARPDLGEIIAFADADVLRALEAIMTLRPGIVALEQLFAETSRGAALINRIKADPSLRSCDIRLVSIGGNETAPQDEATAPTTDPPGAQQLSPLDYRGTRRAERFNIVRGVEVHIEGTPAQLVNMSAVGAQVVSPTILKPNQRVRVSLSGQQGGPRIKSVVAWASFEIPQGVARYRAGLELIDVADQAALAKFIKKNKA